MEINPGSNNILIIDHHPKWVALIRQVLETAGYIVQVANNQRKAIQLVNCDCPDMVLLDPAINGERSVFELIQVLRQSSNIPVICLSEAADLDQILSGFNAGADDYVVKPFNSDILLARMRTVMNRSTNVIPVPEKVHCDNLVIHLDANRVTLDGEEIYLTETEFKLLIELMKNVNKVVLHEQLLSAVWGPEYKNEIIYLRSFIHTLRRKVETNPKKPQRILNRSGIGYILVSKQTVRAGR